MKVRKATLKDKENCLKIAHELKVWFNKETFDEMESRLLEYNTFLYEEDNQLRGFITLREENKDVLEIVWIAVKKDDHRKGIGTVLLKYIQDNIGNKKFLKVKTLDDSEEYKPYEATRSFYESNGFSKIAVLDPYPGWEPGNPCAIYVKAIN